MTLPENSLPDNIDVLVIGAGAAGLMCAYTAGLRGRKVLVVDHANKVGKKILISGGGRCNFTNLHCQPDNFISGNPNFCKSALSRFTPNNFVQLVEKHNIAYHEKKLGQLFCDNKSKEVLEMLLHECHKAGVKIRARCSIEKISSFEHDFEIDTTLGRSRCESLVIATGGLSLPKMGASGFGYDVAKQFGLAVTATQPGLVPFTLKPSILEKLSDLSGSSAKVTVTCNKTSFSEDMLFTHRGLSGPAMLQISSYWNPGNELTINLSPENDLYEELMKIQSTNPKLTLKTILSKYLSKKIVQTLIELWFPNNDYSNRAINQFSLKELKKICGQFHNWIVIPTDTEGYRTAEVTLGGVDCNEISSKTMEVRKQKNLFFIGEVLDVTGHLGGFNFQWAWASGAAAGEFV